MSWNSDPAMQALRLRYNAAVAAHADCSRRLMEIGLAGEQPSAALVEAVEKARDALEDARKKLHAAMADAISSPADLEKSNARRE
jgi:hypothetical protein